MGININIYNALLFQIAWLACVVGGDQVAPYVAAMVVLLHLRYVSGDTHEILLLLQILLLGIAVDSAFLFSGLLIGNSVLSVPPFWLASLWLVFATTLLHSLAFFQRYRSIAPLVGFVSGALSYKAGTSLSDIGLAEPQWFSLFAIGLVWSVIFPLCLRLAQYHAQKFEIAKG